MNTINTANTGIEAAPEAGPTRRKSGNNIGRRATGLLLAIAPLAACSVDTGAPAPATESPIHMTSEQLTQQYRDQTKETFETLAPPIEVIASPLVVTQRAKEKVIAFHGMPSYVNLNYPEAFEGQIREYHKTSNEITDVSVRQQVAELFNAKVDATVASIVYNLDVSQDKYFLDRNKEAIETLDNSIKFMPDGEKRRLNKTRNIVLALKVATANDRSPITEALLGEITDRKLKEELLGVIGDKDALGKLASKLREHFDKVINAEDKAQTALYDGSQWHAEYVNGQLRLYSDARKADPDEALPAARDEILELSLLPEHFDEDTPSAVDTARAKLDAVPEQFRDIVGFANKFINADLAKGMENFDITYSGLSEVSGKIATYEYLADKINNSKLRNYAKRILDVRQALEAVDIAGQYLSEPQEAMLQVLLASIDDEKIKAAALRSNGGDPKAQDGLEDVLTTAKAAVVKQWLTSYEKIQNGSNAQAGDINADAGDYLNNS